MGPLFSQLVEDSVGEIERREPQYLSRFQLNFPRQPSRTDRYRKHPALNRYGDASLDQAIGTAVEYLNQRKVPLAHSDADDAASMVVFDALLDAFAADEQLLPIQPAPKLSDSINQLLGNEYDERRTPSGRRYVVGRQGNVPLVVVNALGIPLAIWSKLLADSSHDFRILTVENRCGDLISGGMHSDVALTQHAEDIAEVLEHEKLDHFHVLGWCNGGRIAIDLVTRTAKKVQTLTLLSPTLRGTEGASKPGSPFEDRLDQIFTTVKRNNALAVPLVKMISNFSQSPDWEALAGDSSGRARALFALPARESASNFLVPMSAPPFLLNYAKRTAADEAYPMAHTLQKLAATSIPVLLITGNDDTMVSNPATCTALRNARISFLHASISGTGHYAQDLQYPYFLWLLKSFTQNQQLSDGALRVSIERY